MKRKYVITILVTGALVIGIGVGVFITARGYEKFVLSPVRYQQEGVAAIRVGLLSHLRLGETNQAIKVLEEMLDNDTLILTQSSSYAMELPENVVRTLKQIKAYRHLYPPEARIASKVQAALTNIPELTDYKKECDAALCRLLETRQQEVQPPAPADSDEPH